MDVALVCPVDRLPLASQGRQLACPHRHVYPIIDGVPVLLIPGSVPTHSTAWRSLNADLGDSPWYLDTVGISDAQRLAVRQRIEAAGAAADPIDPVASFLVGSTSGFLYEPMVGKVSEYPIPHIRLPTGGGKRLLDLGCSWGRWSVAAARRGYRVTGIDPSLGGLTAASRVCRHLGAQADFIVADARSLPFADGSFDVVFSYSVLQHFSRTDALGAIREASRILAPGSCAVIQMPNKFGIRTLQQQARRRFREPTGFEVRFWTLPELRRTFERLIGPATLSIDGFFGLGVQSADAHLMSIKGRTVIAASEALRKVASVLRPLLYVADSVYVTAQKR